MQYKNVFVIAAIMALRMLGLFMILPLVALYALNLQGTTPFFLGLALGIYGLTQACLQMPLGILSDFMGRKTIIAAGLGFFILGSLIAGITHSISLLIVGRALQGAGAVGSTLMALLVDLTLENQRARAMAILGAVIGISFSLSLVLGPVVHRWLSVPSIFLLCAVMGVIALFLLWRSVAPQPKTNRKFLSTSSLWRGFLQLVSQPSIRQLMLSSMWLHLTLMMTFISVPIALKLYAQMPQTQQWQIYLPSLLLSFVFAMLWIMLIEKKQGQYQSIAVAISCILIAQLGLALWHQQLWHIGLGLGIFFLGFNFLEAMLPAQLSKQVTIEQRGMAMGLYSTAQFMGIFLGGMLGGSLYGYFSVTGLFVLTAVMVGVWNTIFIFHRRQRYG